ncbi:MAG: carbohydrate kinase family protein [Planctomycetes bacterium]|nr:carbohydrate kinase family protein [Planctomycetota bacterium]
MGSKRGIAVAGNMIVDKLYPIAGLPKAGELTTITEGISSASGGAVCNVVVDLAKLDPELPLTALGRVGDDEEGRFILDGLRSHANIDCSHVRTSGKTSFTIVMADEVTKQRTFFQYRGANAEFCQEDIDFAALNADLLHIGYILLLDRLDSEDSEYGTKMARLLCAAQRHGLRTSIDVVSESGNRFQRLVPPALKYADYCIINELEAQATTGVMLRTDTGKLRTENILDALKKLKAMGVSRWAVIHSPEGGYGLDENGEFVSEPSLRLRKDEIAGSVGAGDAFCAGVLYAAWNGKTIADAIRLGNSAAACSLTAVGATDGVRSVDDVLAFARARGGSSPDA